jgi:hypothetical protein
MVSELASLVTGRAAAAGHRHADAAATGRTARKPSPAAAGTHSASKTIPLDESEHDSAEANHKPAKHDFADFSKAA